MHGPYGTRGVLEFLTVRVRDVRGEVGKGCNLSTSFALAGAPLEAILSLSPASRR